MDKRARFSVWYILLAVWGVLIIQNIIISTSQVEQITYSEFLDALEENRVLEVSLTDQRVQGILTMTNEKGDEVERQFNSVRVEDPDLIMTLRDQGVAFKGVIENTFFRDLLSWVLPALIFVGIWIFALRRMGGQQGFLSVGKNKAKVHMHEDIGVSFDDVAGVDEARAELVEVVDFLKSPDKFTAIGGKLPHGVLLVGPPGTGKTLLAKAVAGESDVPFFTISGSEFVEMFVGVGASRVRDLFEQAKKMQPCIIFIDELDALGKARGGMAMGGHDEREQTLNQLLVEMDGFDASTAVIIMAATNRPEILDPALLRPGRFDRQVLVDRPDKSGREDILKVHIKGVDLDDSVDLSVISSMTPGMAGADLANLVNEAALLAVRREKKKVGMDEFMEAVERVIGGLEKKNRLINEKERNIVAHHEIGHALVGLSLPGADRVQKITIVPRGVAALGYTLNVPTEERFLMTKSELEAKIAMTLGGRAAEEIVFGDISTGAHNDLSKATDIARSMVKQYGMIKEIGQAYLEEEQRSRFLEGPGLSKPRQYSEETAKAVDDAVKRILDEQYERALNVLKERRSVLDKGSEILLEKEKLMGEELQAIMQGEGFDPILDGGVVVTTNEG